MAAPDVESQLDANPTLTLSPDPQTPTGSPISKHALHQQHFHGPTRPATPPRSPGIDEKIRDGPIHHHEAVLDGPIAQGLGNPLNDLTRVESVINESPFVGAISTDTVAAAIDYHYSTKVPELEAVFPWAHGLHEQNLHQRAFLDPLRRFRDETGLYFDEPAANCRLLAADPIFGPPKDVQGLMVVKVGDELNEFGSLVGTVTPQEILRCRDEDDEDDEEDTIMDDNDDMAESSPSLQSAPVDDAIDAALHPVDLMHKSPVEENESTNSTPAPQTTNTNSATTNDTDTSIHVISNKSSLPSQHSGYITSTMQSPQTSSHEAHQCSCLFVPEFLCLDPPKGISLRNFQVQVAKWATTSNFIVYAPNPQDHSLAISIAKALAEAQSRYRQKFPQISVCRTFICLASIDSYFAKSPHVVAVPPKEHIYDHDEIRLKNWDSNFLFHERVEMSMMSAATVIGDGNVWLGNTVDFEVYIDMLLRPHPVAPEKEKSPHYATHGVQDGPFQTGLEHEAHAHDSSHIDAHSHPYHGSPHSHSSSLPPSEVTSVRNWVTYVECFEGPQLPSLAILDKYIKEAVECSLVPGSVSNNGPDNSLTPLSIQFPSSGSIPLSELTEELAVTFVSLCKLLYIRSKVQYKGSPAGVLIYCNDGYTETSLLALAYIVYSTGVPSSQAWLDLHTKYGRPFFCFNVDVLFMLGLERVLLEYSPAIPGSKFEQDVGCIMPTGSPVNHSLHVQDSVPEWFCKLDGSLPSKILSHLYLGALNHAENPELLTRLGIRRILSVGEVLNWMSYRMDTKSGDKEAVMQQGVYDHPYNGISKVMYIDNILDDGVDALTESLAACLRFIDEGYRSNEATLVHCRVGVSRSATVCIAEVMKRLSVGLPRAYLFVRVRRLNVIIQPNLRFMYELVKWEERNRRSGEGWLREVDWPILCREIALINKVYIA